MADIPTREQFEEVKGTSFEIYTSSEESINIDLVKVDEMRETPPYQSFAIVFQAPNGSGLTQQIYKLRHAEMGELELFLSPFAEDENGLMLESIFQMPIEDQI